MLCAGNVYIRMNNLRNTDTSRQDCIEKMIMASDKGNIIITFNGKLSYSYIYSCQWSGMIYLQQKCYLYHFDIVWWMQHTKVISERKKQLYLECAFESNNCWLMFIWNREGCLLRDYIISQRKQYKKINLKLLNFFKKFFTIPLKNHYLLQIFRRHWMRNGITIHFKIICKICLHSCSWIIRRES